MAAGPQSTKRQRREAARAAREALERQQSAAAARRRRLIQLGGLVGLAAIVVVVAIVISSGSSKSGTPKKQAGETVPGQSLVAAEFDGIPQSGAVLGNPKAAHTLVEYGDLICPACKAYSDQIIHTIVDKYVRTGRL